MASRRPVAAGLRGPDPPAGPLRIRWDGGLHGAGVAGNRPIGAHGKALGIPGPFRGPGRFARCVMAPGSLKFPLSKQRVSRIQD